MALVGRYSTALCRIWVQIVLIYTHTERDAADHIHTELDLGDPTTWVWAMGPVAHARNVGPRYDHYHATRNGVTPRLGRIDCKIQSSSARGAVALCMLTIVLFGRMLYMDGGYGSYTKRA